MRAAIGLPMILLGGVTNLDRHDQAMAAGFDFVAMGRALLREPDLVNRMRQRPRGAVAVHPLQPVHADDLHRHPLRAALS